MKINNILKERWLKLSDDDKVSFREWTEWDKKRYAHELLVFQNKRSSADEEIAVEDDMQQIHVPKKRKIAGSFDPRGSQENEVGRRKKTS